MVITIGSLALLVHGIARPRGLADVAGPQKPEPAATVEPAASSKIRYAQNSIADQIRILQKFIQVIGEPVAAKDYSWQVSLRILVNGKWKPCGGTLIGARYVLTAAHCLDARRANDFSGVEPVTAQSIEIFHGDARYAAGTRLVIDSTWGPAIHQRWKTIGSSPFAYDVAIIRLAVPANNATVAPIQRAAVGPGRSAVVSGWGMYDSTNRYSPELRATALPLIDNATCASGLPPDLRPLLNEATLCTESRAHDACGGDSGGPLVIGSRRLPQTVGVVSWGPTENCASPGPRGTLIGGFTRASAIADWVVRITGDRNLVTNAAPAPLFDVIPDLHSGDKSR